MDYLSLFSGVNIEAMRITVSRPMFKYCTSACRHTSLTLLRFGVLAVGLGPPVRHGLEAAGAEDVAAAGRAAVLLRSCTHTERAALQNELCLVPGLSQRREELSLLSPEGVSEEVDGCSSAAFSDPFSQAAGLGGGGKGGGGDRPGSQ